MEAYYETLFPCLMLYILDFYAVVQEDSIAFVIYHRYCFTPHFHYQIWSLINWVSNGSSSAPSRCIFSLIHWRQKEMIKLKLSKICVYLYIAFVQNMYGGIQMTQAVVRSFTYTFGETFNRMGGVIYNEEENIKFMGTPTISRKTGTILHQMRQGPPHPMMLPLRAQDIYTLSPKRKRI